jgi:hypothetical protein
MEVAIIIGFSYDKQSIQRNYLPGILIDLYHTYNYVKSVSTTKEIHIITDLNKNVDFYDLKNIIDGVNIDFDIENFMDTIKKYRVIYTSKKQILSLLRSTCANKSKVFLYYTGHSENGEILLPFSSDEICYRYDTIHDSIIELTLLRDILTSVTHKDAEIFCIFDCCNFNGLELPYKLKEGVYRLTLKNQKKFFTQNFICISSTLDDESSLASKKGSLFTQVIYTNLKLHRGVYDLLKIVSKVCFDKFDQTASVYSSYPDTKMIWRWLIHAGKNVDVQLDLLGNYFIVKGEM